MTRNRSALIQVYWDLRKVDQLVRLKEKKIELKKKLAKMKQPAPLPGHLGLQAAHLNRDVKQGGVRFSKLQNLEPPLNINIF